MEEIKISYEGVEITYNEGINTWEFQLRGRQRSVVSLEKAKEAIEKEPAEKRKPFDPIPAILIRYSGIKKGKITSYVGKNRCSGNYEWWFMSEDKNREKIENLYYDNEANMKIIKSIADLDKGIKKIQREQEILRNQLQLVEPTPEMLE